MKPKLKKAVDEMNESYEECEAEINDTLDRLNHVGKYSSPCWCGVEVNWFTKIFHRRCQFAHNMGMFEGTNNERQRVETEIEFKTGFYYELFKKVNSPKKKK